MIKVLCILLLIPLSLYGNLSSKIHSHLSKVESHLHVGAYVIDTATHQVLYQHNAYKTFSVASTLKVVTALAALKVLGPDFRFETLLAVDPHSERQKLNLYLKFSGDPSLTKTDLLRLFEIFKDLGLQEWQGDLILDDTCYGNLPPYNPGMTIEDMEFCLGKPTTPIIVNGNQDQMTLTLPLKQDSTLRIRPQEKFYKVQSATALRHCLPDDSFDKKIIGQNLIFSGCLDPKTPPLNLCIPIQDSKAWVQIVLQEVFQELGFSLKGKIKFGEMPEDVVILTRHYSLPLPFLLKTVLKESNNLFADALFLTMGRKLKPNLEHWAKIGSLIKEVIRTYYGLDLENSCIEDGSGLSKDNLVTPHQLGQLMNAALKDPKIKDIFISSLAVGKKDGTLKNRLQDLRPHQAFYGKTGRMRNVRALVGYVLDSSNPPLIIVIISNGISPGNKDHTAFEEKLIQLIADERRNTYVNTL